MAKLIKGSIDDLVPDDKNANIGSLLGKDLIEKSIGTLGLGRSVLVDKDDKLIAGNKATEGARANGVQKVIFVETDGTELIVVKRTGLSLDSDKGRALALADNKTAEVNLTWDPDNLQIHFDAAVNMGMDNLVFDFNYEPGDGKGDKGYSIKDEETELPNVETITTDIVYGDIFDIGDHRLICGDSTNVDDVKKLLDGAVVDMVLTNPPYGVSYVGKTKDALTIDNDSLTDEETFNIWRGALNAIWGCLKDGGSIYATVPAGRLQIGFMQVMYDLDALRQVMVWNKSSMVLGHSDYHYKHEPILYGWKPGAAHYFTDDRTKTTVLDFDKPNRNGEHPTMKPIPLWAELMNNSSRKNESVYDPFSGSGTTMITADQIGRKAYCAELSPKYCQVIIDRMKNYNPDIVIKRNGKPI